MFNIIYVEVELALESFGSCERGSILQQTNTITNSLPTLLLLEVHVGEPITNIITNSLPTLHCSWVWFPFLMRQI